tara:strand:- start:12112 stop:12234 length:123 start_codon:yes stop_codon:yes gene_type:complete
MSKGTPHPREVPKIRNTAILIAKRHSEKAREVTALTSIGK